MKARRGITLVEIMVALAVIVLVTAVAIPSMAAVFDLEQRGAAKQLVDSYRLLQTEAMLRNVSFRIAYNLDRRTWWVEVGEPSALIFSDPRAREEAEKERQRKLKHFTQKEIAKGEADDIVDDGSGKFTGLDTPFFETRHELPGDTAFAFVYTPQYGDPVEPSEELPDDAEDERIVYSHVFPDGTMEYTVVRLVDIYDPADGYTVEVEPFSGQVTLDTEATEVGANQRWIPSEAPTSR
ncbi:MAG: prepilin-type N-terminal cleavage/methylation domain-containing protein [Deltaproteobacteria bacterium]|nr:prepilin-type N-terminal cleavage/methylation domain-containing protein [Deltaproteobacteria bacterium]